MPKTIKQILTEARDLISDPERWTQGEYAIDDTGMQVSTSHSRACAFCADGALTKSGAPYGSQNGDAARMLLSKASQELFRNGYVTVNDGEVGLPDTISEKDAYAAAHANILAVFDRAIADCVEA